jgi:hypothetical protein
MKRVGALMGWAVPVLFLAVVAAIVGTVLWHTQHHAWFWVSIGIDCYLLILMVFLGLRRAGPPAPYESRAGFARLPLRAQKRCHE